MSRFEPWQVAQQIWASTLWHWIDTIHTHTQAYPRSSVVPAMMGPAMQMTIGGNMASRKMVVSS